VAVWISWQVTNYASSNGRHRTRTCDYPWRKCGPPRTPMRRSRPATKSTSRNLHWWAPPMHEKLRAEPAQVSSTEVPTRDGASMTGTCGGGMRRVRHGALFAPRSTMPSRQKFPSQVRHKPVQSPMPGCGGLPRCRRCPNPSAGQSYPCRRRADRGLPEPTV
jgi:hypothetical protein